jgi:pyridoxal phosphate enzyme (YggS family)
MADSFGPALVGARVAEVHERIRRAGGTDVQLLAVTKGFGATAVTATLDADVVGVGENYAQELLSKAAQLASSPRLNEVRWHFIGRLQRNKVRQLAPVVSVWQSVDRVELSEEIAKRAPGARVFVQVNCSGEQGKGGAGWDDVPTLVDHGRAAGLAVEGLMGVGPAGPPERAREGFERLVALADELGVAERSIGMSHDLEVAVEAGSTMVRVGEAIFGPRPRR